MKALFVGLLALTSTSVLAGDWQDLGADAWHSYNGTGISAGWKAEGDTLSALGEEGGDLVSNETYRNFELVFEWQISEGGNSGVMFHVLEKPELKYTFLSGPEYQVLDNKGRSEPPLEQAGALFALYAPSADYTKPVGEFNEAKIVVNGGHVEHWLNGHKVVEYDMNSNDFKAKVAATKFGKWPTFASGDEGHIALQDHGNPVTFRHIRVKRLPD
ncbi:MAG: DUF1080 domain-containing protein [Alphaproteobacteria bacterium]|nr:MAG: DUF1080 domain-containing protein [Alphaproteobacteria bacterium]